MNEDFQKKMRALDSRLKHVADEELADMRQWYYSLPIESRREFKEQARMLAEISDRFALDWGMFVKVHYSWEQYDEEGTLVADGGGGRRAPVEIHQAIDQWDETEPMLGGS